MQPGYRHSLYRARQRIEFVYFIETGVGSLVNTMKDGRSAEVGTIGNEGVVGCRCCWTMTAREERLRPGSRRRRE